VLSDHSGEVSAFVISFLVIWVLWTSHHRTMEYFDAYDAAIMRLTMLWLFTIVVLPFTTQLLNSEAYRHGAVPLYIGVLLVSSLCLLGMSCGAGGTASCCWPTGRRSTTGSTRPSR
jgi:uncharacterized membrane protein